MNSGIYSITNTVNGKIYYGSSCNIYQRWHRHKSELRHNKHINTHLQRAWNKYGEIAFVFKLEIDLEKEQLLDIEQTYLDKAKETPDLFYNQNFVANKPPGIKFHTQEALKKMSGKNNHRYGLDPKKHPMYGKFGLDNPNTDKTVYTFKNTNNNELFQGIKYEFCKKYNLFDSHISKLIKRKRKMCDGWILTN